MLLLELGSKDKILQKMVKYFVHSISNSDDSEDDFHMEYIEEIVSIKSWLT